MTRYARPRGKAEVQPNIEAIRLHPLLQNADHLPERELNIEQLLGREFIKTGFVRFGRNEQVSVVIWEQIQHHEGKVRAMNDEVGTVFLRTGAGNTAAKEAILAGRGWLFLRHGDVRQPPRCP